MDSALWALVALQTLQTVQFVVLRRDVRASLRPPPRPPMPPRCLICGLFHDPPACKPPFGETRR